MAKVLLVKSEDSALRAARCNTAHPWYPARCTVRAVRTLKAFGAVACSPDRQECILRNCRYQRLSARGLVWHLSVTTVVSHLQGELQPAYQVLAFVLLRKTREKAMPPRFVVSFNSDVFRWRSATEFVR